MPKRRSMILGLGALAMGSGAAFTSAALQNAMAADADFRVVVEDDLVVEPGSAFRDGSNSLDDYDPGSGYTVDTNSLLDNDSLGAVAPEDLPAAAVSDDVNEDLDIEVATGLDDGTGRLDELSNMLQVRNEGNTTREVAFGFSEFGDNVADGTVSSSDVIEVYEFEDEGGNKISTDSQSWDAGDGEVEADNQTPAGHVEIGPGEVEQITLQVDTTVEEVVDDILEEAEGLDNPFEGGHVTVDLVNAIFVGTNNEES